MPTYGYRCQSCSTEFEVWQKMTDLAVAACPACGAAGVRQFFPAGIVFKGSGFYKTDSRKASSASVDGGAGPTTSTGSGAPAGPTPSTPSKAEPARSSDTPKPTPKPAASEPAG